jgi:hypothetical protein
MARVKQDQHFSGPVTWRIVELNVSGESESDDLYVSFSSGGEHGPIIERVGNDSPRMVALDENAIGDSYTTDPDLQRLGCWFISPQHKDRGLCSALLYLGLYWKQLGKHAQTKFRNNWQPSSGKVADELAKLNNSSRIGDFWDKITSLDVDIEGQDICARNKQKFKTNAQEILDLLSGWKLKAATVCTQVSPSEQLLISPPVKLANLELTKAKVTKWLTILLWSADTKVHTEELLLPQGYQRYQGYQGCGDLSMNFWNVGLIKAKGRDGGEREHFVYPFDEPVEQRAYTCLVKWKKEGLPPKANIKHRIEIRELKFNRHASSGSSERASLIVAGKSPLAIADKLEFAVYGQQVIRDGELVDLRSTILQYSDLRHIFLLPNLNPSYPLPIAFNDKGEPTSYENQARPRIVFSRQQSDDVWLGEFVLLKDRNRRMAALSGPVSFELSELGATEELIEGALYAKGLGDEREGGKCYERERNPLTLLKPGQWRKTEEGREVWYEIYFRRNEYPCSMVGLTEDGRLLLLACRCGYSSRKGWTIEQAAKHLASRGVESALLIDEGGDVYQHLEGETSQIQVGRTPREQVRATLIIASL